MPCSPGEFPSSFRRKVLFLSSDSKNELSKQQQGTRVVQRIAYTISESFFFLWVSVLLHELGVCLGPHTSILLQSSQQCVVLHGNARRDIGHNGRADSLLHARRAVLLECEVYLQYSGRFTIALNQHITQTTGGCYMSGPYLPAGSSPDVKCQIIGGLSCHSKQ